VDGVERKIPMVQTITRKLVSVDAEKLVVEMTVTMTQDGKERVLARKHTHAIPAKPKKAPEPAPGGPVDETEEVLAVKDGKETVEVAGKMLETQWRETTTKMMPSGATIQMKVWTSSEIPGGTVKIETTRDKTPKGTTKIELVNFEVAK
jgi:hypothetical protein